MPLDLSKALVPRDFGALIPAGTIAPMQVRIKPGNYGEAGCSRLRRLRRRPNPHTCSSSSLSPRVRIRTARFGCARLSKATITPAR